MVYVCPVLSPFVFRRTKARKRLVEKNKPGWHCSVQAGLLPGTPSHEMFYTHKRKEAWGQMNEMQLKIISRSLEFRREAFYKKNDNLLLPPLSPASHSPRDAGPDPEKASTPSQSTAAAASPPSPCRAFAKLRGTSSAPPL